MEPDVLAYWIGARYDEGYGVHRWLDGTGMTVKGWGFGRPGKCEFLSVVRPSMDAFVRKSLFVFLLGLVRVNL
jgi:hypothetical protein